ncbi:protein phosphatase 2C domain-containing protein [Actinomadura rudentiformis]|uniref:Protein phosphatase 2C domain-containing protein n=1 Tax=Actinomadura rudentiformis TaxID=359158 RepID=A0A6H9YAH3_9ACTN|nr:protein phosphatase 2C domain-containing protein [Actinomadura rudentiformis]
MNGRGERRRTAWRVHGLSVTGYRHRRDGVPCQDAWRADDTGPVTVLAVSDGAGSRSRSAEGSKIAVKLATDRFGRRVSGRRTEATAVHGLLRAAYREVRDEFLRQTAEAPDDFAATLTVVVLAPTWIGHLSVGDGFVLLRAGVEDGEPQFHLLPTAPEVSEYSNETVFLTSSDAEKWVRTACVRDSGVDGVLLSTDGLAQAALANSHGRPQIPNASFASTMFASLENAGDDPHADTEALAAFLRSDRVTAVNADDKTVLRAVRS